MVAVGAWGLPPSEFWRLSPAEFWLYYESKVPPEKRNIKDKWASLYEMLE
jgi:hypothetical protein